MPKDTDETKPQTEEIDAQALFAAVLRVFEGNKAIERAVRTIAVLMRDASAIKQAGVEVSEILVKMFGVYEEAKGALSSGLKGRGLATPMSDMARQTLKEYDTQKQRHA